jgi:nucleoside-diphosphate-sugar epimerase
MILVTGATGLVGSHLLLHLVQNDGKNVRALYRKEAQIDIVKVLFESRGLLDLFDAIEWIFGDILDVPSLEIAFQEVSLVYHCAGLISFDPSDEVLLRKTNIEGTANIVNFCIDRKVKKLCHVSSIAALGDLEANESVLCETTKWNPERLHSDYAISKYGAEMEVWRGQQEGLNVVIVNPGVILGEGSWTQGSGLLFNRVWNGLSFYTQGITGYVAVEDVVRIMITLMHSDLEGERYVVLSENISYEAIIIKIAERMGVKPPSKLAQSWMLQWAWRIDFVLSWFGKKRFLTQQGAASLQNLDLISNAKSTTELQFVYASIDVCLDRLVPVFMKDKR